MFDTLVSASKSLILDAFFRKVSVNADTINPYDDGHVADKIIS